MLFENNIDLTFKKNLYSLVCTAYVTVVPYFSI